MSLDTKSEKLILIKDSKGVARVVLDKDPTAPKPDRALSIKVDAESTDVITTVNTYQEVLSNFIAGTHKLVQKALFVKDMATQAGTANRLPIYPGATEYITFQPGESALVYYDDDVQTNGFGRPHWFKFLNDNTLADLSITKVTSYEKLKGKKDNVWYFVEDMKGYEDYGDLESALVLKRSDTDLETWRSEEDDYMDGTAIDLLHNTAVNVLSPGSTGGTPPRSHVTANYVSQVENLKKITDLSDLTHGVTKAYTFPNGMDTDTVGGCELSLAYVKDGVKNVVVQGYDLRGWDTTKPLYLSITYNAGPGPTGIPIHSWLELIMEAVPGDKTKYTLRNYKSGAGAAETNILTAESIQFKGGQ